MYINYIKYNNKIMFLTGRTSETKVIILFKCRLFNSSLIALIQ